MNNKTKLIGWSAIAIAIISLLSALIEIGTLQVIIGFIGSSTPFVRVYWVITRIILPLALVPLLVAFGLVVLQSKPKARMLALTYSYGNIIIAALKALGAYWMTGVCELLDKILIMLWEPISLPLIYAFVLAIYYTRKTPESQQSVAGYPPQGVGSPER